MEDELSPEHAERVRRMLADARHTEPMPADVAAQMDRVLAGLAEEPDAAERGGTARAGVVPLAQRRRRAGRLLLAAAAVVVGGVAVAQLGATGGGSESMMAGDTDDTALEAPEREADGGGVPEAAAGDQPPGAVASTQRRVAKGPARVIRPRHFARDARRARLTGVRAGYTAQTDGVEARPEPRNQVGDRDGAGCEPEAAWGGGRYVPVSYGRSGGWLVIRPPVGDTQVVDLFLCGDEDAVRSATLPFD